MDQGIYQYSVPIFSVMLKNLSQVLALGEANAKARKIDPQVFLNARLAPDMLRLVSQVQIAVDHAKGAPSRLAGLPVPSWPDGDDSFEALHARITKSREYLKSLDPGQFAGAEERDIHLKIGGMELDFKGIDYLNRFAMPNFQFHTTMVYAILRHNGVPLGKKTYLGGK
jgi:hypothetical protein